MIYLGLIFEMRCKINTQDQVCSLKQAKRLCELGVKQNSIFYLCKTKRGWYNLLREKQPSIEQYSAFTVAELGEFLYKIPITYSCYKNDGLYQLECSISQYNQPPVQHTIFSEREADARAIMLTFLIENHHINVEYVNGED
jgi:hypothetical protein